MARPGPPPKPTALRLLEGGNRGKRPLPFNEPQPPCPVEVPAPPSYVSGYARVEWERVIGDLCSKGVYANVDQTMLAAYCMTYGRWRLAEDVASRLAVQDPTTHGLLLKTQSGNVVQNPAIVSRMSPAGTCCASLLSLGLLRPRAQRSITRAQTPMIRSPGSMASNARV